MTKLTDEQCRRLAELIDSLAHVGQRKYLSAHVGATTPGVYQCFVERTGFFSQDGDTHSREQSLTPSAALLAALERVK